MSEYVEMDMDAFLAPLAKCNRCGRSTFSQSEAGREDRMPQPDGNPCGGLFVATPPQEGNTTDGKP